MKYLPALLLLPILIGSANANNTCRKPTSSFVNKAFKIIENNQTTLCSYLDENIISKMVRNDNCETMYHTAIRSNNQSAISCLESRGFDLLEQVNTEDTKLLKTLFEFVLQNGSQTTYEKVKQHGGTIVLKSAQSFYEKDCAPLLDYPNLDFEFYAKTNCNVYSDYSSILQKSVKINGQCINTTRNIEAMCNEFQGLIISKSTRAEDLYILSQGKSPKIELAQFLIQMGADVSYQNGSSSTLLSSIESRNEELTELLIKSGANLSLIPKQLGNIITLATRANLNTKLITSLLREGYSLDVSDSDHKTPIFYAIENNRDDLLYLFANAGADLYRKDRLNRSLMYYVVTLGSESQAEFLQSRGLNINLIHDKGNSLMLALASKNYKILNKLINEKANVNYKTPESYRPIDIAVQSHAPVYVLETLINAGANINSVDQVRNQLENTLQRAVKNSKSKNIGNLETLKYLIQNGANINHKNYNNETVLHLLVKIKSNQLSENDKIKIANLFFSYRVNMKTKSNYYGFTAYDLALRAGLNKLAPYIKPKRKR